MVFSHLCDYVGKINKKIDLWVPCSYEKLLSNEKYDQSFIRKGGLGKNGIKSSNMH